MRENRAIVRGTIIENPEYFSATKADEYYMIKVKVIRKSGVEDIIPVVMPRKTIDPNADYVGLRISVDGTLQTIRKEKHLIMYVFAKTGDIYYKYEDEEEEDLNEILFSGSMKNKVIRKTGKKNIPIADVHFLSSKYYFPCIAWNDDVQIVKNAYRDTDMRVTGRFQSREYTKVIDGDEEENKPCVVSKTASEISISKIEVI